MNIEKGTRKTIYRKDFENRTAYTTKISKKNMDGNYENGYIAVQFTNNAELENKTTINIKKGWLSFYKTKEGKAVFYVVVSDFEIVHEEQIPNIKTKTNALESLNIEITDEDLPF